MQIQITEIMGLVRMFGKKKTKKAPLPKLGAVSDSRWGDISTVLL